MPRRQRRPRLGRAAYPELIAQKYESALVEFAGRVVEAINAAALARFAGRSDADEAFDRKVGPLTVHLGKWIAGATTEAAELGDEAGASNRGAMQELLGSVIPVNPAAEEPWLEPVMDAWKARNVGLIKSIPEQHHADVEKVVGEAWDKGTSVRDLRKRLEARGDITRRRAELIARDQMNKLNGQLSMVRQTAVGVEHYTWETARDERVRESHANRDGTRFPWNQPPEGGHPGTEILCRCSAEPDVDEALDKLLGPDEQADFSNPPPAIVNQAIETLGPVGTKGAYTPPFRFASRSGSRKAPTRGPRTPRAAKPSVRTPRSVRVAVHAGAAGGGEGGGGGAPPGAAGGGAGGSNRGGRVPQKLQAKHRPRVVHHGINPDQKWPPQKSKNGAWVAGENWVSPTSKLYKKHGFGNPTSGPMARSVFHEGVDQTMVTLWAATRADAEGLWMLEGKAHTWVNLTNEAGEIGYDPITGRRTTWVRVVRREDGSVHAFPNAPPEQWHRR